MEIFPNQIIIVNTAELSIENSIKQIFKNFKVYIHKNFENNLILKDNFLFYGEYFHDQFPEKNNSELLENFHFLTFEEKIKYVSRLSGYFLFLIEENNEIIALNDCSGQFETYYFNTNGKSILASQPNLIFPFLDEKEKQIDNKAPKYIIENKINIFDKTPLKFIYKIIPNHLLEIKTNQQIRFYPKKSLVINNRIKIAKQASDVLQNSFKAYSNRKNLALALTAGWDSRILFASGLKILDKITLFVLNHKTEDGKIDAYIANQIAKNFNKKLNIIDYNLDQINNPLLENAVWKNDKKIHLIANLNKNFFPDSYLINGNISEIVRNFYDPLPKKLTTKDICYISGLKEGKYETYYVEKWLSEFREIEKKGYHRLDFIYWENKMPNWAGNSKSISNLYNIVLSPFNNRYLIDLLLATNRKKDRDKTFHKLYKEIINIINPELNSFKINPTKKNNQIKLMKKLKIYKPYRITFFKLRKLKF